MKVKTITIVGGGSSGWMAAAAISKLCPHIDLTLVESSKIKTIGVGESTLGHVTKFLGLLGLRDEDWMAHCNATYKNSIRFTNFRENDGTSFQYPFSLGFDLTDKPNGIITWGELATIYPDEFGPNTFAEFYATANTLLSDQNKQTKNLDGALRHYDFRWDTAYHVDAQLFGEYLRDNIAIPNGVKHIHGHIKGCEYQNNGGLKHILLEDGTTLASDLFLDCTGFKSLLLGEYLGVQFKSFDTHLANDCAWACRIPYEDREKEMHNYTDCHAIQNGWVWNIPLWNRIGTGYVYSSKFVDKDQAQKEFREHLATTGSKERAENAEMYHINIKHGRRAKGWEKNVVGIGLSYGFVEPLESTGLLTTHENIIKLVEILNRRNGAVTGTEKLGFNFAVEHEVLKFRDFVSQHYALSLREDTPYWHYQSNEHEFGTEMLDQYVTRQAQYMNLVGTMTMDQQWIANFPPALFIAAGMGLKPISTKELIILNGTRFDRDKIQELEYVKKQYYAYKERVQSIVDKLPSHYKFLLNEIYNGKDDYA